MAHILHTLSLHRVRNAPPISPKPHSPKPTPPPSHSLTGRRQWLLSLTAATALTAIQPPSMAQDIPLFGLRKNLRKAEEEVVEIVKEGFETAEREIETAEKGIETAEMGIVAAEEGIEAAVSFSGVTQAAAVAGAEVVGILVATSVVNGILRPEGQKS